MSRIIVMTRQGAPISEQLGVVLAAARLRGDEVTFYDIEKARPSLVRPACIIVDDAAPTLDVADIARVLASIWEMPGPPFTGLRLGPVHEDVFHWNFENTRRWYPVVKMDPEVQDLCLKYNVGEPPDYKRSPAQHARQYTGTGRKSAVPNMLLQRLVRKLK